MPKHKKKLIFINMLIYTLSMLFCHSFIYPSEEHISPINEIFCASFDQSMHHSCNYDTTLTEQHENWRLAKALFNQHIINFPIFQKNARIPKIIHQIWLGSQLPQKNKILQETWIKNNPSWVYIFWTDNPANYDKKDMVMNSFEEVISWLDRKSEQEHICIVDVTKLAFENRHLFNKATNYGERSDIARYEILYKIGGLYIDTDFECLKPFDALHHCCDFFAGVSYEKKYIVYNGLIGSKPGHAIVKKCIENIKKNQYKSNDIQEKTGPYLFTRCIEEHIATCQDNTIIFPVTYFYPWSNYDLSKPEITAKNSIKDESFAIHHWHRSWFCS